MHMPGHKRNYGLTGTLAELDVTELTDTDDLHDARGILKDAMERTASMYGALRTWYLVNGSTCGILSAIRAAVPAGGEVI
ncbi:MAG: decarboxylase, partial [Lachnospiraceae bacterium]|nr:decarboxylase [Lachnospiraceae bacterium]